MFNRPKRDIAPVVRKRAALVARDDLPKGDDVRTISAQPRTAPDIQHEGGNSESRPDLLSSYIF